MAEKTIILYMETNNKEQKMMGWAGTVFGILGAVFVAVNMGLNDIGYIFFTIGSVFSLASSIQKKQNDAIILWGVFLFINIIGLFSYLK